MSTYVTLAVEGDTDAIAAARLLGEVGLASGTRYVKRGKGEVDRRLSGYNDAARFSCWLVIRDLDRDAPCAPDLIRRLLPSPAIHMRFHVAVRSVEAWFLADAESLSRFLGIARRRVPPDPESLDDPKSFMVELARHSRKRSVREAIVPSPGTTARVGPGYASSLAEFAARMWRPEVAALHSPSLARLRRYLSSHRPRS